MRYISMTIARADIARVYPECRLSTTLRDLAFRPIELVGRRAYSSHRLDELVEYLLGLSAWHNFIDRRNEVETRLPTEFGCDEVT